MPEGEKERGALLIAASLITAIRLRVSRFSPARN